MQQKMRCEASLTGLGGSNGKLHGARGLLVVALEDGGVDARELAQAVDGAGVGGRIAGCDVDLRSQGCLSA